MACACAHRPQVFRSHHPADRDAKAERQGRGRNRQQGLGALGAPQATRSPPEEYDEFYKHVAPRFRGAAGARAQPRRRQAGIHLAPLYTAARALRSVGPRTAPRHQAVREARVHHGRRRAADAEVPALRARRDRLQRSAAEHLARNPAAQPRHRRHPQRLGARRCWTCSTTWRQRTRRNTPNSGPSSGAC